LNETRPPPLAHQFEEKAADRYRLDPFPLLLIPHLTATFAWWKCRDVIPLLQLVKQGAKSFSPLDSDDMPAIHIAEPLPHPYGGIVRQTPNSIEWRKPGTSLRFRGKQH